MLKNLFLNGKNMKLKNKIYLFPFTLLVIFFSSFIIISSPVGKKNIVTLSSPTPTSTLITSEKALNIIEKLPEVIEENKILSQKETKTVLYIESEPSNSDSNFHIYFGESFSDHQNRLVTFLVDSKTGKISVDTLLDPEAVDYSIWKNNCQIEACQK